MSSLTSVISNCISSSQTSLSTSSLLHTTAYSTSHASQASQTELKPSFSPKDLSGHSFPHVNRWQLIPWCHHIYADSSGVLSPLFLQLCHFLPWFWELFFKRASKCQVWASLKMSHMAFILRGHLHFLSLISLQNLFHDQLQRALHWSFFSWPLHSSFGLLHFIPEMRFLFCFLFYSCFIEFMFLLISSVAQSNCRGLLLRSLVLFVYFLLFFISLAVSHLFYACCAHLRLPFILFACRMLA